MLDHRNRRAALTSAAVAALVFVLTGLTSVGRADAYVRTFSKTGAAIDWRGTTCLPVVIFPKGFAEMTADEVANAAIGAAAAWSPAENACTYLTMMMMTSADDGPVDVPQPHAAIVFRQERWCKIEPDGGCSADPDENAKYEESALMITTVAMIPSTGQIIRGSTEVNVRDWRWADLAAHPELADARTQDFQNALTHELGHFIGFDHTCAFPGTTPWPIDDQGERVPDCYAASADVRATTMFASADPGDLQKRTLAPEDQRGLCALYPVAKSPGMCVPPTGLVPVGRQGCACATGDGARGGPGAFAALALALAWRRRRSRIRRPFC